MYIQSDGVADLALCTAAVPVLAQGLVGDQGVYISPANDMVGAWFCTSDAKNQEETMARAIVKKLSSKQSANKRK